MLETLGAPSWLDKSLIYIILLFGVWYLIHRERKILSREFKYHVATLRQLLAADRAEIEASGDIARTAVPGPIVEPTGKEQWNRVREIWNETRERIESRIDDLDGRVKRKYARMPRFSYDKIINQLRDDDGITTQTAETLLKMNERYLSLRPRPSTTSNTSAQDFEKMYTNICRELPRPTYD